MPLTDPGITEALGSASGKNDPKAARRLERAEQGGALLASRQDGTRDGTRARTKPGVSQPAALVGLLWYNRGREDMEVSGIGQASGGQAWAKKERIRCQCRLGRDSDDCIAPSTIQDYIGAQGYWVRPSLIEEADGSSVAEDELANALGRTVPGLSEGHVSRAGQQSHRNRVTARAAPPPDNKPKSGFHITRLSTPETDPLPARTATMRAALLFSVLASAAAGVAADAQVNVDVTLPVVCERTTKAGDRVSMHYRGTLADTGKQFDASYDRGQPLTFKLGSGQVIKGWDQGLLDMCIGEKRTLTIPPELGYGQRSMGPIPGGSTLVFETELIGIDGVPKPDKVEIKIGEAASSASESVSEAAETASAKVVGKIASVVAEVADAALTMIADTDDTAHEEL
ncbi:hypothetical protein G7046_g5058 [Stylonectria norvegica]|nr:hypothetical protein G7046_g5058 [Stylonectria norvegica]